jgi:excisionase family DNA binding protein
MMDNESPLPPDQEFLTVKQAAKYLNVSASCVYRLCITGKMAHYKFGDDQGAIRINRSELLVFIQRCRVQERSEPVDVEGRHRRSASGYIFKHLFVDERHPCGGMTKAGTPCTRLTREERCLQHQPEQKKTAK